MDEKSTYGKGYDYATAGGPIIDGMLRDLSTPDKAEWLEGYRDGSIDRFSKSLQADLRKLSPEAAARAMNHINHDMQMFILYNTGHNYR